MRFVARLAGLGAALALPAGQTLAQPIVWAFQAEQLEYRVGEDGTDVFAWDTDTYVGEDELKLRWLSKGEFAFEEDAFEELENQLRLQTPVSTFWDVVAGVRVDTPEGPDRVYGVVGVHGLAPQWIEVDADLFVSDDPEFRIDAEYEGLITNWITLTPSVEVSLPFTDDREIGMGAFGPTLEIGARLSYDLVDRAFSPYIGVHYERVFGETADLRNAEGEDKDALFFVVGARILF